MNTRIPLLLTVLLLVSCTKSPSEMIVGNWLAPEGKGSMEFFQDGAVTLRFPNEVTPGIDRVNGTWAIIEEGKLRIDFSILGQSVSRIAKMEFPGKDQLTITDDEGAVDHFTRTASSGESPGIEAAATSTSVLGVYGGNRCVYQRMVFKERGKLYLTIAGMEVPASYELDGNKISVTDGQGGGVVFTRNGDILDGGIAGICTKIQDT